MAEILGDSVQSPVELRIEPQSEATEAFDEDAYLRANPDVAESLAQGEFRSAFDHFAIHGRNEHRPLRPLLEPQPQIDPVTASPDHLAIEAQASEPQAAEEPLAEVPPAEVPVAEAQIDPRPSPPIDSPIDAPIHSTTESQLALATQTAIDPHDDFDEAAYLRANPDVQVSLDNGEFRTAFDHFALHGRRERRPLRPVAPKPLESLPMAQPEQPLPVLPTVAGTLEAIVLSPAGGLFLVGWVDDLASNIERIEVSGSDWTHTIRASVLTRLRRSDVEAALGTGRMHRYGYFAFSYQPIPFDSGGVCRVLVHLRNNTTLQFDLHPRRVSDTELRNIVLGYVPGGEVFGNRDVEASRMLSGMLMANIVRHNRDISRGIVNGAYVERFGTRPAKIKGSIVVCLYGKPQYMFLQNAMFAGGAGFEDYELIYVSNSPEMAEQLMKDARACAVVYGLPLTLVLLPGNAGFGAANNVAVNYASSDRILIVNPDVFPRDSDWARKHSNIVADLPTSRTQLFGVPLYYDDGSLMHGGMYFEYDTGLSMDQGHVAPHRLVRVEHYGKGAPAFSERFTRSRPVPAVTGAFISAARAWYEKLGGFTEDFVFGHYEDGDLCLKSLAAGAAPWIHDVRLWHMEGKGSTRHPVHEGGSHVNRALFAERWDGFIAAGLEGPDPTHPLMQGAAV